MRFRLLFLLLLTVHVSSKSCSIPNERLDECYFLENARREENCNATVSFRVANDENGRGELIFDSWHPNVVARECSVEFHVVNISKTDCDMRARKNMQLTGDSFLHTEKKFFMNANDTYLHCLEVKYNFSYIFTGCYQVYTDCYKPSRYSLYFYVTSKYKKVIPEDEICSFKSDYRKQNKELLVRFNHESLKMNNGSLTLSDSEHNAIASFGIRPSDTNENDLHVYKETGAVENIENPTCTYKDRWLTCVFKNLLPESYIVNFELRNEPVRCNRYSLWNNNSHSIEQCNWHTTIITITDEEANSESRTESDISVFVVTAIAIFMFIFIGFIVYVKCRKCKKRIYNFDDDEGQELRWINKPKIFLLYAKDCEEFMDLMETFRNILKNIYRFEVFDIYDTANENDIAVSADNWMVDKLQNCKTVLLLTQCGEILDKHLDSIESLYKIPNSNDNYFSYAIRCIKAHSYRPTYNTSFLVSLEFDQRNRTFEHINCHTRYSIPENLIRLISDLEGINLSDAKIELLKTNELYSMFVKKYEDLERFCKEKPNYLEDILHVKAKLV